MKGPILSVLFLILLFSWASWTVGGPWWGATMDEMNDVADQKHLYWKVESGIACDFTGEAWDEDHKSYQGPRWFVCGASPARTIAKLKNSVLNDIPEFPDRDPQKWTNVPEERK